MQTLQMPTASFCNNFTDYKRERIRKNVNYCRYMVSSDGPEAFALFFGVKVRTWCIDCCPGNSVVCFLRSFRRHATLCTRLLDSHKRLVLVPRRIRFVIELPAHRTTADDRKQGNSIYLSKQRRKAKMFLIKLRLNQGLCDIYRFTKAFDHSSF